MKITYSADAPLARISIEGVVFAAGETKDVNDKLGDLVLRNANFVDENGRNPHFECGGCGKPTFELATMHLGEPVSLRHADEKLRCVACFHAANTNVQPVAAEPISSSAIAPAFSIPEAPPEDEIQH
jgi:hypothetical protein